MLTARLAMQSSDILNNARDLEHENKLSLATDEKTLPENMYVLKAQLQQQMLHLKKGLYKDVQSCLCILPPNCYKTHSNYKSTFKRRNVYTHI